MKNSKESILLLIISTLLVTSIFFMGYFVAKNAYEVKPKEEEEEIIILEQPSDTLSDWEVLQMAIVMTESKFNPEAVGKDGDWGIFQQVPIYVAECNRILSLRKEETRYVHEDSFDVVKAIEMFNLLQSHYNPEKDLDKAIRYQNKAGWYKKRVQENIIFIRQMEDVRRSLRDI